MSKNTAHPGHRARKAAEADEQPSSAEVARQATVQATGARSAAGAARTGTALNPKEGASEPPAASANWLGKLVQNRYRVVDKLGEGGMGIVYVAEHINLRKKVAFKVIHPELSANDDLLARFTREALATGQLDHAHICSAIDFDRLDDGSAYLVMPFVRGQSLQAELEDNGSLPWRRVARYGSQIADALSAAHALGIVHRDLKPDNVLVETLPDGSQAAKVLDFGVASLTGVSEAISSDTAKPLTQAGTILGTPGYMSPEQATAGEIDHRTDLYALGVILWELCAGRRLFYGLNVTEIFAKQFNSVPEPLSLGSGAPREFASLVAQLLEPRKEDRPSSAAEVRDVLRRLAEAPDRPSAQATWELSTRLATEQFQEIYVKGRTGWRQLARKSATRWKRTPASSRRNAIVGLVAVLSLIWALTGDDDSRSSGKTAALDDTHQEPRPTDERPNHGEAAPENVDHQDEEESTSLADAVGNLFKTLPEELVDARTVLNEQRQRHARVKAARSILNYKDESKVPPYLELIAKLELSRGCRSKREKLTTLVELEEKDSLPYIQYLHDRPKRGCSLFGMRDCLACMRSDLDQALEALE